MAARLEKALPSRGEMCDGLPHVNLQVHEKGDRHERMAEHLPCEMVLQVPHNYRAEISEEGDFWNLAEGHRGDFETVVRPGRGGIDRGACDGGPCAPVFEHPA